MGLNRIKGRKIRLVLFLIWTIPFPTGTKMPVGLKKIGSPIWQVLK